MSNATSTQPAPLTARLDRLTPEGRIAWHVERAAVDRATRLMQAAVVAVERAQAASERLAA